MIPNWTNPGLAWHFVYTMRGAPSVSPFVTRAEAEVEDVSASDSDDFICLGSIAKPQIILPAAGRSKDRLPPTRLVRASDSNQRPRATKRGTSRKYNSGSAKSGTTLSGGSKPTRQAETRRRKGSRSNVRARSRQHRHPKSPAMTGDSVILGWTRRAGQSTHRRVQASFGLSGRFSCSLFAEPDQRPNRESGRTTIIAFKDVVLVKQFQGKTYDEVKSEVKQILKSKPGLSANCGEVWPYWLWISWGKRRGVGESRGPGKGWGWLKCEV